MSTALTRKIFQNLPARGKDMRVLPCVLSTKLAVAREASKGVEGRKHKARSRSSPAK